MQYSSVADSTHYTEDYFNLGLQKAKQGDREGAIANFNLVIQIEPERYQAYHNRGIIWFKDSSRDRRLYRSTQNQC